MKSRAIERLLTIVLLSLVSFYLFSSSMPVWATLVFVGLTLLAFILLSWDLGCSMVFIFPVILLTSFILAGIIKIEFLSSIMFALLATALVLTFASNGLISISSLIFIGVYLSLAKPHGTVIDLLYFGSVLGIWYLSKSKLFNLKIISIYVLSVLIIAAVFYGINFVPLKPVLSSILAHQEQQIQKQNQETGQIFSMRTSQKQYNSKKSFLTEFIDKVWFPVTLLLFGSLLFIFSLNNFGIKGTLKLFVFGMLIFTVLMSSLSLFLRFIKPSESTFQQITQQESTEQHQEVYQPLSSATIVVENSQTEKSKINITPILDVISTSALLLVTFILVYSILKNIPQKGSYEQKSHENIPQDIEFYPLESIPEYEPSERFILGAYWWLRRKYFPQHHHLTPFEILKVAEKQENLSVMTNTYVKLRYAKQTLSEQEMKAFYENLLDFVQQRQDHDA